MRLDIRTDESAARVQPVRKDNAEKIMDVVWGDDQTGEIGRYARDDLGGHKMKDGESVIEVVNIPFYFTDVKTGERLSAE